MRSAEWARNSGVPSKMNRLLWFFNGAKNTRHGHRHCKGYFHHGQVNAEFRGHLWASRCPDGRGIFSRESQTSIRRHPVRGARNLRTGRLQSP